MNTPEKTNVIHACVRSTKALKRALAADNVLYKTGRCAGCGTAVLYTLRLSELEVVRLCQNCVVPAVMERKNP